MAYGVIKTLMTMLAAQPSMAGVALDIGEEKVRDESIALPRVVIVPRGGIWQGPGYSSGIDQQTEMIWETQETIDVYLISFSTAGGAQPVDHFDAVENLRAFVLQAFQTQREGFDPTGTTAQHGLWFKAVSGEWVSGWSEEYGRAYKLQVRVDMAYTTADLTGGEATITNETVTTAITNGQHIA